MARYLAEISYDGTKYAGWQSQLNALGIQEVVEKAMSKLLRTKMTILACGRTDAGVHAKQSFFHFDFDNLEIEETVFKLNKILPVTMAIHSIVEVKDDFHARFQATSRSYEYVICKSKNPFDVDRVWFYSPMKDLSLDRMNEAAKTLLSYKDFYTFSKSNTDVNTYLCQISQAEWEERGEYLIFKITADRFLRGMVRLVVGMCVNVSRGKVTLGEVKTALENKERLRISYSVPATGLYLTKVKY